jgi:hypothetical protein
VRGTYKSENAEHKRVVHGIQEHSSELFVYANNMLPSQRPDD